MNRLGILGILILMVFVVSGYVASSPQHEAREARVSQHPDPHVGYYEQHLRNLGIALPVLEGPANPVMQSAPAPERRRTIFL